MSDFISAHIGLVMGIGFVLMATLGMPLFLNIAVLALLGFGYVAYDGLSVANSLDLMLEMFRITESEIFLAIPFFTLAGSIMTHGTISDRLVAVANALFAWMPGGLAIACIMASVFFAALSGSSAVTIIAIGAILYPALRTDGYSEKFSLGLLTTCGALGILLPPSLPLIIYGVIAQADIGKLFIAGVLPGLVTVLLLIGYSVFIGLRIPGSRSRKFEPAELGRAVKRGVFALLLPFIMLIGIYGGLMTPTEAAVVAVVYALIVESLIHRDLRIRDLPGIVRDSMILVGTILIILLCSMGFTSFITDEEIPLRAAEVIRQHVHSREGFLIAVNLLLLIAGSIMDIFSALIVIAPLIVPIAEVYQVDLIHLGIVFVLNLEIGFAHPPFGINLFIAASYFKKPVMHVFIATVPYLILLLLALGIVTFVPGLSSWLVPESSMPTPAEMFKQPAAVDD